MIKIALRLFILSITKGESKILISKFKKIKFEY